MKKHKNAIEAAEQFKIGGSAVNAEPYGSGHINDTYAVTVEKNGDSRPFLLQRINTRVFKKPELLMDNILSATTHIRTKLKQTEGSCPDRETLTLIPTLDNRHFLKTDKGEYWRCYIFIENATAYDICQNPAQALEAARAFRTFEAYLSDLPANSFNDTIPFFHHSPSRFEALKKAITYDSAKRASGAEKEINFALERENFTHLIVDLMDKGFIPERVTHNDTKLNNVLIDDFSHKAVCVIDLDTIMPGSLLYDFGDMVRTSTPTCLEDEADIAKVDIDMDLFKALAQGFLEDSSFMTKTEIENMALAGRLITFTIGIRFLADHLSGDTYFKTHRPNHNLERARVQFRLVEIMEGKEKIMKAIIKKLAGL